MTNSEMEGDAVAFAIAQYENAIKMTYVRGTLVMVVGFVLTVIGGGMSLLDLLDIDIIRSIGAMFLIIGSYMAGAHREFVTERKWLNHKLKLLRGKQAHESDTD